MFVGSLERMRLQVQESPVLAIVDLACTAAEPIAAIRELRAIGIPVIAFGAHVDVEALQEARKAGANQVMPRSKFVAELEGLVAANYKNEGQQ